MGHVTIDRSEERRPELPSINRSALFGVCLMLLSALLVCAPILFFLFRN